MKRIFFSAIALGALSVGAAAHANQVGGGLITFEGNITEDSCIAYSTGAQNQGSDMRVLMGSVSKSFLGTEDAPDSNAASAALGQKIDLVIQCGGKQNLTVGFEARSGTQGKGIAVTGGAKNVQLMLVSGATILDFTNGQATIDNLQYEEGAYKLPLNAYYSLASSKTADDVVAGPADALVAYTISYQ